MNVAQQRRIEIRQWGLMLPAGWSTLSTSTASRSADVRRMTNRMMRGRSRDELVQVRIDVERTMAEQLESAYRNGATEIHVLTEPIAGTPVSASLTVAPLTLTQEQDVVDAVLQALGAGEGVVEHGTTELAGQPAIRRRRRYPIRDAETAGEAWATAVEYVVETDPDTLLVLTFTTTTDLVADALVALFDAMAGSLHVVNPSPAR